ncbi:MAG: MFS transporter [Candidatus Thorarchaeota archaeon]
MEIIPTKKTFKSYIFFWIGQLFSILGSLIVQFVIVVWVTLVTESLLMVSLVNFFFLVPTLIISPFAGVFSDRYDRKKLILIVDSLQAFLTLILIGLFQFNLINLVIVFSFVGLRSTCQAFHSPTVFAIVPSMVPKDQLGRMNGLDYLFSGLVSILGTPIGAIFLFIFREQLNIILWVDVITFLVALVPLLIVKIPKVQLQTQIDNPRKNSFLREFRMGFKVLRAIPGLFLIMIVAMLANFLLQPMFGLMSFYILEKFNGSILRLGILQAIIPAASLFGALVPIIKKNWKNKVTVMFFGIIIVNMGYLIYALLPLGFLLFPLIPMGFVLPIINALVMTILQTVIPKDKIGRVSSIIITLSMLISPLGTIISGPLSLIFGLSPLYVYCATIGIIVGITFYSFTGLRHIDYDSEFELNIPE